jgi:Mn-dependent DtxR family transcriptional regulator
MSNDRSYLTRLQDYYSQHRALPSYASIGQLLGLKSKSSVAAMVARLKLAGYIDSTPDKRLAPTRAILRAPGRRIAGPRGASQPGRGRPRTRSRSTTI